jgi:hypothetical protein
LTAIHGILPEGIAVPIGPKRRLRDLDCEEGANDTLAVVPDVEFIVQGPETINPNSAWHDALSQHSGPDLVQLELADACI